MLSFSAFTDSHRLRIRRKCCQNFSKKEMKLKRSIFTTSKTDRQLSRQKVRQIISVFAENWHFNSHFVLKTTKRALFVFITEIL